MSKSNAVVEDAYFSLTGIFTSASDRVSTSQGSGSSFMIHFMSKSNSEVGYIAYFSLSGIFTSASDRVSTSQGAVAPFIIHFMYIKE